MSLISVKRVKIIKKTLVFPPERPFHLSFVKFITNIIMAQTYFHKKCNKHIFVLAKSQSLKIGSVVYYVLFSSVAPLLFCCFKWRENY